MPREALSLLNVRPDGRYVDATLGSGGHAELIAQKLDARGRLLTVDWDKEAWERSRARLESFGGRVVFRLANFRDLPALLSELSWPKVHGFLFDLGASSEQILDSKKGLSFQADEPLDMRIDSSASLSAQDLIQHWDIDRLTELFEHYGEPRGARRLAVTLKDEVNRTGHLSARQVSQWAARIFPRRGRRHPATRIFLALRSAVNDEEGNLRAGLNTLKDHLALGGVGVFISFHSLEDGIVKRSMRDLTQEQGDQFRLLTPKPLVPSREEIQRNPRSRSAKLRAVQRISEAWAL